MLNLSQVVILRILHLVEPVLLFVVLQLLLRHLGLYGFFAIVLLLLVRLKLHHALGVLVHLLVVGVHDTFGLGYLMVDLV